MRGVAIDMAANQSGAAFRALLDLLRDAEQSFVSGPRAVADQVDVAEGYRHLTHLLGYALDLYLDADPEHPAFTPLASPTRKILGDNVDSLYHFAPLRGDRGYRIRRARGRRVYLAFCVYRCEPVRAASEGGVASGSPRAPPARRRHVRAGDDRRRPAPGLPRPQRHWPPDAVEPARARLGDAGQHLCTRRLPARPRRGARDRGPLAALHLLGGAALE